MLPPGGRDWSADEEEADVPLLETVAQNVPIVLFAIDGSGVFTRSEGRGLAALGLEADEVVGQSVFDIYADHPHVLDSVERALDGENVNEVHEFDDVLFETWYRPRGENGVEGVLGVAVDVTERVKHERLLERLNEANRRLLGATSEQAVAEMIVEIADEVLDHPYTGVWFHEPDREALVSVAGDGAAREYSDRVIGADTVEMAVFEAGESRHFEDYSTVEGRAFPDASVGTLLLLPLGDHGLFSVASPDVVDVDPADRDLIEILARDATAALDRSQREQLLERLNEASRELMVAESPASLAHRIVDIAREVLDEPASVVWYYDADAGVLEPVSGTTEETARRGPARPYQVLTPIESGTAEMEAFLSGEPVFFDDYTAVANPAHPDTAFGAILAVPIGDRGLLTVGAARAADMDPWTPDLVEILARDAAVALERVDRVSALEHLHTATRAFMGAETAEEIAQRTVDTTADVLGHPLAVVRLRSADSDRLEPVATSALIDELLPPRPSFRVGEGAVGTVFERQEVMRFGWEDLDGLDVEDTTDTLLCLPLGDHGVLSIGEAEPAGFDDSDVQLARILALNVEAALDRIDRERELERRNERLDEFAEIVSHDLRNPLNVISGHVELAEVQEPHRSTIEDATTRMRDIIDEVLELARQGHVVSDPAPTDAMEVARHAWASVETGAATLEIEGDLRVEADRDRLQRLFENLIRNAVEHGPDDGTVRIGATADGFYVEDDGPGIPDADREAVFDAGYSTADGGTGLGLAIVAEIAEAHGWSVSATGGHDGGARFEVKGATRV